MHTIVTLQTKQASNTCRNHPAVQRANDNNEPNAVDVSHRMPYLRNKFFEIDAKQAAPHTIDAHRHAVRYADEPEVVVRSAAN